MKNLKTECKCTSSVIHYDAPGGSIDSYTPAETCQNCNDAFEHIEREVAPQGSDIAHKYLLGPQYAQHVELTNEALEYLAEADIEAAIACSEDMWEDDGDLPF